MWADGLGDGIELGEIQPMQWLRALLMEIQLRLRSCLVLLEIRPADMGVTGRAFGVLLSGLAALDGGVWTLLGFMRGSMVAHAAALLGSRAFGFGSLDSALLRVGLVASLWVVKKRLDGFYCVSVFGLASVCLRFCFAAPHVLLVLDQ